MDIFNALNLAGAVSLFLFGMTVMGQALERRSGNELRSILSKMTSGRWAGLLSGIAVTAVIQSSGAATVMVVGFVNSGLMSLAQAVNVIMGANIGTTVTAWLLSLADLEGGTLITRLLKPSSFTPIMAVYGVALYMLSKNPKKKDTGMIFLGFATLMYGMEAMMSAVSGLQHVPGFTRLFLSFSHPLLGIAVGAVLTALIQSSSASVGILQALAATGAVSFEASVPIIMGQNIGTCTTALLSSIGTTKNARRAAVVHLLFNVIGSAVWLIVFSAGKNLIPQEILEHRMSSAGIAVVHSAFNLLCAALLFPASGLFVRLVQRLVPDSDEQNMPGSEIHLDERLLKSPSVALARSRQVVADMAEFARDSLVNSLTFIKNGPEELALRVREAEDRTDACEDALGSYLVRLSVGKLSVAASMETATILKSIGDFERIADHAVNIVESGEEMRNKKLDFSPQARREMAVLTRAVQEIADIATSAYVHSSPQEALEVEPLEEVIDNLKDSLRDSHIRRLQRGNCSVEAGFVWSDLLTDLERIADHYSNIAGTVLESSEQNFRPHTILRSNDHLSDAESIKNAENFERLYESYSRRFSLPQEPVEQ